MFAAGAAALLAGCSDATRFTDPFSDPFQSSSTRAVDRAPTGTISAPYAEGPRSRIQSRPLPPPQAVSQNAPAQTAQAEAAPAVRRAGAYNHWSAEGGTPVVVAEGETAGIVATRYGVPTDALLRVNGYSRAAEVQPGSRIVIPVYRATAAAAEPAPIESRPAKTADLRDRVGRTPKKAEEVAEAKSERKKIAAEQKAAAPKPEAKPQPVKPVAAKQEPPRAASAKPVVPQPATSAKPTKTKVAKAEDDEETKPTKAKSKSAKSEPSPKSATQSSSRMMKTAQAETAPKARAEPSPKKEEAKPAPEAKRPAAQSEKPKLLAAPEAPVERKVDKTPTASIPPQQEEKSVATADAARPEFRWPARGRIIQGFNSGGNDGINISVPEGTQVKAAEGGVVAYAGSELKGYGNLVLIRHPNGFVSAYAHNAEIEVKRGDQVKRGQTIAKSGQSGNVGSPQLHFELRKGATPVDPTNYLAGL